MHVNNLEEREEEEQKSLMLPTFAKIFLNSFLFFIYAYISILKIYQYSDWFPMYVYPSYINVFYIQRIVCFYVNGTHCSLASSVPFFFLIMTLFF